jgi:DNA-binding GntR family transcriptional regulator
MKKVKSRPALDDGVSLRERAYLYIQRKIALGELPAGSRVSEPLLAREMGISRTPIREAIGQLVSEGLLDQTPNLGAVVVRLTRQDIIELYELREALEVHAVGKAARHPPSQVELERIQQCADAMLVFADELRHSGHDKLNAEQMHRLVACDLSFHALLVRLAANARMLKVVNETRLLMRIFFGMRRKGHSLADLEQIHRYHCDVLRALAEQDRDRAMQILAEHIQVSLHERLAEFDLREREAALQQSMPRFFDQPETSAPPGQQS